MEHNTLQGVIFDLDGTLLDSTGVWAQVDRQIFSHFDRPVPDGITDIVRKMSIDESSRYFVETYDLPCSPQRFQALVAEMAAQAYYETLPLKPGVESLLQWLDQKGFTYGVATANYPELAKAALQRLGIWDRMAFLLTEQELGTSKSDPAIFREGARRLQLGRRQIAVVEDSLHAVETAKAAGFFTVGVYDPVSQRDWNQMKATATVHVERLDQLPEVL